MTSIELLNCDCMDYMKGLPDNAFDLAIVDPPYGIDIMNDGGQPASQNYIKWERKAWDKIIPEKLYFDEIKRTAKNQIVWGGNYFTDMLKPSRCWLIWDKIQRDFSYADFEMAWTSFAGSSKAFNMSRVEAYTSQNKIHPTQKPVKLYNWLLTNYAKEGDKILDTHLGSGSSAIAAHYGGFDFVGCEIDEDYFEAAKKRFEDETKQLDLLA